MRLAAPIAAFSCLLVAFAAEAYPLPRQNAELTVSWENPSLSRGPWVVTGDTLGVENDERRRNVYLVPASGGSFVRMRLTGVRDAWLALLFRAEVHTERPLRLRGYGLAVNGRKGRIEFLRFDEGGVRESGAAAENEAWGGRDRLDVCLWHVGANFVATVYDGVTYEAITSVAWSDPTYVAGALGVQLAGKGSEGVRIAMSMAPADPGPLPRPWLSEQWLGVLPAKGARAAVEPFGERLRWARHDVEGEAAVIGDEVAVTALARQVPGARARPGVPFKYRDPGFLARSRVEVRRTATGVTQVEGLKDEALVSKVLEAYAERFPEETRLEEIGRSHEGRPLHALRISADPDDRTRPVLLLAAAHHANEAITSEMVLDAVASLLERPRSTQVRRWLTHLAVVAVPMVNPDGSHAFWHVSDQLGRSNRRPTDPDEPWTSGVDLNRNYPFRWGEVEARYSSNVTSSHFYKGPSAGSEPEVAAMLALGERERPVAVISYHAAATRLLVSYTSGPQANPEPSVTWMLAEEMVAGMQHSFRRKRYETARNLYSVSGTDQNWYLHQFGSASYILEAPYSTPVRPSLLREAVTHSRYAWQYLLERWCTGPSLSVRAVDGETGEPLEAVVSFDEIVLSGGERWTTHPETGWFHRYLPGEGTYTIRLHNDDAEAVRELAATTGVSVVEVEL